MKFKTECGLQTITNLKLQMEFHTGEEFLSSTYLTREFVILIHVVLKIHVPKGIRMIIHK